MSIAIPTWVVVVLLFYFDKELPMNYSAIQFECFTHIFSQEFLDILACPHLHMIETIDSKKLADKVDKAWASSSSFQGIPLNIMVQINTSNEPRK